MAAPASAAPAVLGRRIAPGARAPAWRPAWATALGAVLVARGLTWGAAAVAHALWGAASATPADLPGAVGAATVRWDSVWLHRIAEGGYPAGVDGRWAFWPGFPLASAALGGGWLPGVALSVACSVVALALLHELAARELGPSAATRAVWLVALFPGALFLGAYYSEGPFLLETVGAVWAARRGHWPLAAGAGAAAALTRSSGALVGLALAWEAWRARAGWHAAWLALVPAAPAAFLAYAALRTGDGLAPLHAQALWGRGWHGPLGAVPLALAQARDALRGALPPGFEPPGLVLAQVALLAGAVGAAAGALRSLPIGWGAYGAAALALPLSQPWPDHPLMSLARLVSVLFPLFLWLAARTGRRPVLGVVLAVWVAGLVVASARFGRWEWVA